MGVSGLGRGVDTAPRVTFLLTVTFLLNQPIVALLPDSPQPILWSLPASSLVHQAVKCACLYPPDLPARAGYPSWAGNRSS